MEGEPAGLSEPLHGSSPSPVPHATPLVVLFLASIFEMIAASLMCSDDDDATAGSACPSAYAVSVGAVSAAACFVLFMCQVHRDTLPYRLHSAPTPLAVFLLAWWAVAWLVLTFVAPFTYIGNGFFATWIGVCSAVALCQAHVPLVKGWVHQVEIHAKGHPVAAVAALGVSSTVVALEAAVALGGANQTSYELWALLVGLVSAVACGARVYVGAPLLKYDRYLCWAVGAWWLQGLALSFVREWVTSTVNGYVALWVSIVLALKVAATALSPPRDGVDGMIPVPQQDQEAEATTP